MYPELNGRRPSIGARSRPGVGGEAFEGRDEASLSLVDLLRVLWKRLWLILLSMLLLTVAVTGYSLAQTPVYEASVKLLVGQKEASSRPDNLSGNVEGLQKLTDTMAQAANSRPVAEAVIQQLGLQTDPQTFLSNLSVRTVTDTQFIQVSYRDPSPKRAQQVADAVGEEFSKQISTVSPSADAITATVWEPAQVPTDPVSPRLKFNIVFALVVGLMLGVGLAFLLEFLDSSWRSPEEAEQISGVPTFGAIPEFEVSKRKRGGY
jgi:capsular polysaccharide biosynthesis protein